MGILPWPWGGCSSDGLFSMTRRNTFFYQGKTPPSISCVCCPSFSRASMWRECLYPLCNCPLCARILWWGPPEPFLLQSEQTKCLQLFPLRTGSPALWSNLQPSFGLLPDCPRQFWIVLTWTRDSTQCVICIFLLTDNSHFGGMKVGLGMTFLIYFCYLNLCRSLRV